MATRTRCRRTSTRDRVPTLELGLVLDLIYGPMIFRLMAGQAPLNAETAKTIVNTVFDGIEGHTRPLAKENGRAAAKGNTASGGNSRPATGKQTNAAKEDRQPGRLEPDPAGRLLS